MEFVQLHRKLNRSLDLRHDVFRSSPNEPDTKGKGLQQLMQTENLIVSHTSNIGHNLIGLSSTNGLYLVGKGQSWSPPQDKGNVCSPSDALWLHQ